MKKSFHQSVALIPLLAVLLAGTVSLSAAPRKTEAELIQMLQSHDYKEVLDALDRLPRWYPTSTNALPYIRELLRIQDFEAARTPEPKEPTKRRVGKDEAITATVIQKPVRNLICRKAARSLANYHAALEPGDLDIICGLLKNYDPDAVMDGLKALRGLKAPEAVPQILPLLHSDNHNVVRDSLRTLTVLGDRSLIPQIEPLLKDTRPDVRQDAADALTALKEKS